MLGIPANLLEGKDAPGAVSEQTAKQMAENILVLTDADFALSITGVAGPAESEGKTVGLVYIGLAEKGCETIVYTTQQSGSREIIKLRSAKTALFHLWKRLSS
jgi:nicotinamide-nucleotide amidase